jgi:hypothetical protein
MMFSYAPFNRAASMGRLYVQVLTDLRQGQSQKSIDTLEMLLDSETMSLSYYEASVPKDMPDPSVYQAAAKIRQYRAQYPSVMWSDAELQKTLQRGLDLGLQGPSGAPNGLQPRVPTHRAR